MKAQILTTLILMFSVASFAQSSQPSAVILPHTQEGFVRLMVTEHNDQAVTVLFKKGDHIIKRDVVETKNEPKGFIKLYDVRNLTKGEYTIEVYNQNPIISFDFSADSDESIAKQFWKTQLNNNNQFATSDSLDSIALNRGN